MGPDLWARVSDLMHRSLDVPEGERRAWIAAEARGDADVMAEVERLLAAHAAAGAFLESPAVAEPGAAAAVHAILRGPVEAIAAGSRLGPYRIVREIGRGGMGTVYLAARADDVFEKQVAIKVSRAGPIDRVLVEQFTRERQVLAGLDHPGIARVLDGGAAPGGAPYLVMEYVDGTPIHHYCLAHRLEMRGRLGLFLEVCRAVQYAHDRLVVHRDIKASNVLVGHDGRPRLLDFGIAKLLASAEAPVDSGSTQLQAWTPESASPEQVRGSGTTVATDVYGLGALLYRLIAGRPVFELSGLDAVERARVVCETTPRPPTEAAETPSGASRRPRAAAELDAIALKALHKEPGRRYASAAHLAEDVERFLAGRPVTAAPDGALYRTRKFVERHPVATAAASVAAVAVLAATLAALWQARRADIERARAQARLADVRRLANTLIFDLFDGVANTPNATPIRRSLVQQGLEYLERQSADAPPDPQLRLELARAYGRLAQVQGERGQSNLGDRDAAVASLEKGRALLAPLRAQADVPIDVEIYDLRLLRRLAGMSAGDRPRAQQLAGEGVERSTRLRVRYPDRNDVLEASAEAYFSSALVADAGQALDLWARSNDAYRELVDRLPGNADMLRSLALTEKYIGTVHELAKRFDQALPRYERALELDRRVQRLRPNDRRTTMDVAFDLSNIASMFWHRTPPDLARATALYRESLALREQSSAADPQDVFARQALGFALVQLADLARQSGDFEAALRYSRRAVDAYESLPPGEHLVRRGNAWRAAGLAASGSGRPAEACEALRRAQRYYQEASRAPDERELIQPPAVTSVAKALEACAP